MYDKYLLLIKMDIPNLEELCSYRSTQISLKKYYPEFVSFINDKYGFLDNFSERIYWYKHNLKEYPKCPICGQKIVKYHGGNYGYSKYCSKQCSYKDPQRIEKLKQTCLERYGVENISSLPEFREKAKQTCLERYGAENPFASEKIKEKIKNILLERYNVEYAQQSPEIQNTRKLNSLKKYGVDHHMKDPEIKKKAHKESLKYYVDKCSKDGVIGYTEEGHKIMKCPHPECDKCSEKFYIIPGMNYYARKEYDIEPCTRLFPITWSHAKNTTLEMFVQKILDDHNIQYECNVRDIIKNELDIYIPSKNLAIECNGCFWHSVRNKDSHYHIDKFVQCKEKRVQLITLWEDQIKNKPNIVESVILSKLGIYKERIYARKCNVKEIKSNISTEFLEKNHIQGRTNAKIRLGLYYNDDLYGVMTFSPRSKLSGSKDINSNEWELTRFCTKLNTQIIGAAGKLLKYFIKKYNPFIITSFASNDISNGNLYKNLGFVQDNKITSAYWYVSKTSYIRYHRTSFTKNRLKATGYDIEGKTEAEIMSKLPYYKIYDSGHTKYILSLN